MSGELQIQTLTLGPWQTNCYLLNPGGSAACWIVDASFEADRIVEAVKRRGLIPELLLLTHAHVDHIAGVEEIRRTWPGVPVLIHGAEAAFLGDPVLNLSAMGGLSITARPADRLLHHGDRLTLDDLEFEIRHTPGHSPGGIAAVCHAAKLALVGDTLFHDSIGRSDFPTSDPAALMRSIREQLLTLPDDTVVHPGHGPATTIGRERRMNPFLEKG